MKSMKKTVLTLIMGIFLLSIASASSSCEMAHYNMNHQQPNMPQPTPIILTPQHYVMKAPVTAPLVNHHHYAKPTPFMIPQPLNQQHIVKNDCCKTPIYNNYQQPKVRTVQPLILEQQHYVNTCNSCTF